tara:strand:+ start:3685 stop:4116 length:432 start_codon:yes stop_codon:yes gene_type:complete
MRKIITLITLLTFLSCSSQNLKIKDFSDKKDINYIFARINLKNIISKELYDRGIFIKIFEISDSKATLKNISEGTEEFLSSYIISVVSDGDYYTGSKLYKVEGLLNPKIIEIQKESYPDFIINIEYGTSKNRKIEILKFEGVK